jgi:hypothetical protein
MTQISLKLFNKLPFARNDIGNLPRAGRLEGRHTSRWCFVKQGACMCVFQMTFRKGFPIDLGPRPPALLQFFPADHDRVAGVRCQS